jgi:hypothetical protein
MMHSRARDLTAMVRTMSMSRMGLLLLAGLLIAACGRDGDRRAEKRQATATVVPATSEPGRADAAASVERASDGMEADPLLLAVCRAHDEVVAEGVPPERLLQFAALRSMERHGVTEAQMSTLGATPQALLASILARGAPPACAQLIATLKARL